MTMEIQKNNNHTHTILGYLFFIFGFSAFLPHGLSATALLLVLATWLLVKGERTAIKLRLPANSILVLLMAFTAWPFFIAAIGDWHTDTSTRLFHAARVTLILVAGLMVNHRERLCAFKGLIWGGVFCSLVVVTHHFFPLPPWKIWHHLLEVKGSQSSRAMIMLALACGVCLSLWLHTRKRPNAQSMGWAFCALVFALVTGFFSISRNAHLVLLAMPVVIWVHRYRSWRAIWTAFVLCILLVIVGWTLFPSISSRFTQAFLELQNVLSSGDCNSSVGVRFAMYKMASQQLIAHPWIGTGIGSFVDYWIPLSETTCPAIGIIRQPHNDFLLFAMESGWMGLLTTLAVICWFVKLYWQQRSIFGSVGLMLCTTLLITGLVNSPMRDAGIGFVMLFLLAACTAKSEHNDRRA
jgi:O-antigen ligase